MRYVIVMLVLMLLLMMVGWWRTMAFPCLCVAPGYVSVATGCARGVAGGGAGCCSRDTNEQGEVSEHPPLIFIDGTVFP